MADIKSFPNNQDEYVGAEYAMKWLHGRTSGVFAGDGNAAVTAVAGSMAVRVADGVGWIANAENDGVVWWNDTEKTSGAKLQLSVDAADGELGRIDRVIVTWKTTNYIDLPTVTILKGTPASSPTAPALENTTTQRQISLARISVPKGTTQLTPSLITDERLDSSVCGLVTDGITIDTTTMQGQFEALLASIQEELAQLEAGTAVELKKLVFSAVSVAASAFAADSTYEDYGYRAAVPLTGVTASMIPQVVFSISALGAAGLAPVAACYNGGVYIYADSVPDAAISIETVICWHGGA